MNRTTYGRALAVLAACLAAPSAAADWAADEAEIRQHLADSTLVFNRGDLPGHLAAYDESVTFLTRDGPRAAARAGCRPLDCALGALGR